MNQLVNLNPRLTPRGNFEQPGVKVHELVHEPVTVYTAGVASDFHAFMGGTIISMKC